MVTRAIKGGGKVLKSQADRMKEIKRLAKERDKKAAEMAAEKATRKARLEAKRKAAEDARKKAEEAKKKAEERKRKAAKAKKKDPQRPNRMGTGKKADAFAKKSSIEKKLKSDAISPKVRAKLEKDLADVKAFIKKQGNESKQNLERAAQGRSVGNRRAKGVGVDREPKAGTGKNKVSDADIKAGEGVFGNVEADKKRKGFASGGLVKKTRTGHTDHRKKGLFK